MESRSLQCQHMEHVRIASPRMERYTIVLNLLITGEKVMKNRRIIKFNFISSTGLCYGTAGIS